ncbi:hypothetical protein [Alteromonas sp. 14N.309.X.WAT.G.H12]|uniref:lipopolysaccharide biosynthesis protein n=1 Tax=Alteromonas sp. 14N.309.X.WAT.G.H12 TaxID=3120824 RepID=UPI002FCEB3F7
MKKFRLLSFSFLLNILFGFGYAVIISRLLGVESRGVVYAYQLPSLFIATIVYSIFSQPIFEYTGKISAGKTTLHPIVYSLVTATVIAFIVSYLYDFFSQSSLDLLYFNLLIITQGINLFFIGLARFNSSKKRYIFSSITTPACLFLVTFSAFLYFGYLNEDLTLALIAVSYSLSTAAILLTISNQVEISFQKKQFSIKQFTSRLMSIFIHKSLNVVSNYIDKLIIVSFFSSTTVGLIATCMTLESVSSKLYNMMANYQLNNVSNKRAKRRDTKILYLAGAVIGLGGVGIAYLFGALIIELMFGNEFVDAAQFLWIIIATSVANGITWLISQDWLLQKSYRKIYLRQTLGLAVIAIGLLLIQVIGKDVQFFLLTVFISVVAKLIYTVIRKKSESKEQTIF